ncbi:MAG: phosphatase PAP2 family protein [Burkholderiales bacterium]
MLNTGLVRSFVRASATRLGTARTLTFIVVAIDAMWLVLGGWSLPWRPVALIAVAIVALFLPLSLARYRRDLRIRTTVLGAALLIAFQAAGAALSYLVVSTNAPLVDASLASWDRALGFDWVSLHAWLMDHTHVQAVLRAAYYSGLAQLVAVVLFLGFTARPARLEEFMRLFIAATLMVVLLSGPFPAAGAWKHYAVGSAFDLSSLSHFEPLRDGRLHEIVLNRMQGLISVPSLHSAMAVLLIYVMRSTHAYPLFVVLNAAMLASTPIEGGHYLVDVLAGIALAAVLIAVDRHHAQRSRATIDSMSAGLPVLKAAVNER